MVYIECLIMEMDKARSLNIGTEWHVGGNASYNDTTGVWGGGFSGGAMGGDPGLFRLNSPGCGISRQDQAPAHPLPGSTASILPPGFSVGVLGEAITIGNVTLPNGCGSH